MLIFQPGCPCREPKLGTADAFLRSLRLPIKRYHMSNILNCHAQSFVASKNFSKFRSAGRARVLALAGSLVIPQPLWGDALSRLLSSSGRPGSSPQTWRMQHPQSIAVRGKQDGVRWEREGRSVDSACMGGAGKMKEVVSTGGRIGGAPSRYAFGKRGIP